MHDQWIGLIGEITGRNMFVQKTLISYRRHKDNASAETHSDFRQMLMWRLTSVSYTHLDVYKRQALLSGTQYGAAA